MKTIKAIILAPFPDRSGFRQSIIGLLAIGLFITFFLYLIKPFGIGEFQGELFLICVGFGLVTFVFAALYDILFRYIIRLRTDVPTWNFGKWTLLMLGLIIWIAVGNILFMNLLNGWQWTNSSFMLNMIGNTIIVGVFPIIFSGLMLQLKASKAHVQQAKEISPASSLPLKQSGQNIVFAPSTGSSFEVDTSAVRYIVAEQNYVCIWYNSESGLQREMVRMTMVKAAEVCRDTMLVRCHRSYLVNIQAVENVSGNAQGLKLKLEGVASVEIPVSRSFIAELKARL